MAYKRKRTSSYTARKRFRRRTFRRNRRRNRRGTTSLRCMTMMPQRMRVKLHFGMAPYNGGTTVANLTSTNYRFIMGWKPLEMPIGALLNVNPQGWDQWAGMYTNYRALGMKLNIRITSAVNTTTNVTVTGYWSSDASIDGSAQGLISQRYATNRTLGNMQNFYKKTFMRPWIPRGQTKQQYMNDSQAWQDVALNPIWPTVYYLQIRNSSGGNYVYGLQVEGDLYVEFATARTLVDS